jgi:hypothetical protein
MLMVMHFYSDEFALHSLPGAVWIVKRGVDRAHADVLY